MGKVRLQTKRHDWWRFHWTTRGYGIIPHNMSVKCFRRYFYLWK
jgi:hypothetical protein